MPVAEEYVLKALASCRSAALGAHRLACDHCGHNQVAYNSCRNRHCPKCQAGARGEWLEARRADLLPVGYFHVVFTLPASLAQLAWQNKRVMYEALFCASAETLQEIAADPKHLGAKIGFLAVLHTWGQNLLHHPHVHCVVPGGGLAADESRWVACRANFFLPVRVLSRVFRGKYLARLRQAYRRGELSFHGDLARHASPAAFEAWLKQSYLTDWVVYAKPPFGGAEQVLKYLARYTHRVAISNDRLLSMEGDQVTFRWKDYARGQRWRTMTLAATEFIRRFLLHVLPSGFMRIRHYGFLANCHAQAKLDVCRRLLGVSQTVDCDRADEVSAVSTAPDEAEAERCPSCGVGRLWVVETRPRPTAHHVRRSWPFDSS